MEPFWHVITLSCKLILILGRVRGTERAREMTCFAARHQLFTVSHLLDTAFALLLRTLANLVRMQIECHFESMWRDTDWLPLLP